VENKLDVASNRLTVGPGVSFVDFETNLYNAGKFVRKCLLPSCPIGEDPLLIISIKAVGNAFCVNMIGATIGAGVGPFQGLHGLIIDALRSVRIVTSSGDIVTASDTQHKGLFWAVRGAGANFGVVVSATYEIYDAPNNGKLVEADFAYNGSFNASLWTLLQSWDSTYPVEMGLTLVASFNHTTNQVHTYHHSMMLKIRY
jgi:FAD/FMN-containing dehydrogenase